MQLDQSWDASECVFTGGQLTLSESIRLAVALPNHLLPSSWPSAVFEARTMRSWSSVSTLPRPRRGTLGAAPASAARGRADEDDNSLLPVSRATPVRLSRRAACILSRGCRVDGRGQDLSDGRAVCYTLRAGSEVKRRSG